MHYKGNADRRATDACPGCRAAMTGRGARPAFRELPEGEGVSLNAGVEKLDLERMVGDAVPGGVRRLAHQLVEPLAGHRPVAVLIDVASMARAGRPAVDHDPEAHRLAV